MVVGGDEAENGSQAYLTLDNVTWFKYLGSWISEDARCEEDIRAGVGMARAVFGKTKKY